MADSVKTFLHDLVRVSRCASGAVCALWGGGTSFPWALVWVTRCERKGKGSQYV